MKILIAHDGSASSDAAVDDIFRAGLPAHANAFFISVPGADAPQGACDRIQSHFRDWKLFSDALSGPPAEAILKTSQWWRPDLLIIGSDAFEFERGSTLSVPLELVHRARCSVRVARQPAPRSLRPVRLVIGNNGSKACEAVIDEVARRSWPEKTEARVLTVVDPMSSQNEQRRARAAAEEQYADRLRAAGLTASLRFVQGDPQKELVREAEGSSADAIFVGPHCMPAANRFLVGSVATAVLTRARSTVEVVRKMKPRRD